MLNNEASAASLLQLVPSNARTATGNSAYFDVRDFEGDLLLVLDVGPVAGTTPTLDVKVQDNATGSGGGVDVPGAVFAQVTESTNSQKLVVPAGLVAGYIRVSFTLAGTNPNCNFGVNLLGRRKIV
jgi:hypothetical protein